jgi:hypothetical protein
MTFLKLLKNFSHNNYQLTTNKKSKINYKVIPHPSPIISKNWKNEDSPPDYYLTFIIESYYRIPYRPDLAFTYLWSSFNGAYYRLKHRTHDNDTFPKDGKSIEHFIKLVSDNESKIVNKMSILQIEHEYFKNIKKTECKYIAKALLSGLLIEDSPSIPNKYNNAIYSKIKTKFKHLTELVKLNYLPKYKRYYEPVIDSKLSVAEIRLKNIRNESDGANMVFSVATKIERLLKGHTIDFNKAISVSTNRTLKTLSINHKERRIFFLLIMIYSHRNRFIHGKKTPRLDRPSSAKYKFSIYLYYLTHHYLSISLYLLGEICLSDLEVNIENLEKMKEVRAGSKMIN